VINHKQLAKLIIEPTLHELVLFSQDAVELLLFTCAVESNGASFLKQINGNSLGIYQMTPENYNDLWQNYINKKQTLLLTLILNFDIGRMPSEDKLIYDLRFATIMARLQYHRFSSDLPQKDDVNSIWLFYKKYYNPLGLNKKDESIQKYYSFVN
jgi:hypothetical protein